MPGLVTEFELGIDDFGAFKSDGCSETFLGKFEFVQELRNASSFCRFEIIHKPQGHRHNADQVARRPHILCSICVRLFKAYISEQENVSSNVLF